MANKQMKKCSNSLTIKETLRCYLTLSKWISARKQTTESYSRNAGKGNLNTAGGNKNWR
jgi:hypothetical protein